MEVNSYSPNNLPENPPVFTGYIFCPVDRDKDQYIKSCLERNIVCIISSDNKFIKNVRVGKTQMQEIEFPAVGETFGSFVVVVNSTIHDNPFVVAVVNRFSDIGVLDGERTFRSIRFGKNNDTFVDIHGKADTGELDITVNSGSEEVESNFNFLNVNNKAKLKLYVQGDVEVKSDNKTYISSTKSLEFNVVATNDRQTTTSIKYEAGIGFNYKDEFENEIIIKDGEVTVKSKRINLGDSNLEKAAKGETLAELLKDLLTAVSNITTATAIGTQPILNKITFENLKLKVDNILSSTNYIK